MIFTVINIGTGYLYRPNWLLAGYSVYHRVASQGFPAGFPAHNVYDRPAIGTSDGACGTRNLFPTKFLSMAQTFNLLTE